MLRSQKENARGSFTSRQKILFHSSISCHSNIVEYWSRSVCVIVETKAFKKQETEFEVITWFL